MIFPPKAVPAYVHRLFRTLTGLADGLALKELRYAADAGDSPQPIWVPRSPRYVGGDSAEVGGTLANAKTEKRPCDATHGPTSPQNGKDPLRGLSVSGPVSRILSRAIICLPVAFAPGGPPQWPCGLPEPRRVGSTVLFGLAPGGVCLAAASPRRRCALTAPFHLCLYAAHVWLRHRPCHFCGTFPRVSPGGSYPPPCPSVSGLSSRGFLSPRSLSPPTKGSAGAGESRRVR
jgi:hypothetical protein